MSSSSSSSSASPSPPSATSPLPSPLLDGGGASALRDRRLPLPAAVDAASSLWMMASLFLTPSLANLKSPTMARSDAVSSTLEEACRPPLSLSRRPWTARRSTAVEEATGSDVRRGLELLLLLLFLLAMSTGSDGVFCVCKPDQSPAVMQKAIDYTCWRGADCTQIMQSGAYYQPNTISGGAKSSGAEASRRRMTGPSARRVVGPRCWQRRRGSQRGRRRRRRAREPTPSSSGPAAASNALAIGPSPPRPCRQMPPSPVPRRRQEERERLLEGGDDMWASLTFLIYLMTRLPYVRHISENHL
uniref:X8 domain-containing protein n=1 Tax=Oryza meridionalis TaxID=40149 RepID=A0A0E0CVQ5_9ORYZ